jgi:hypothetical protein
MLRYIEKDLQQFQHPTPQKPEHSPHAYSEPQYGAPIQYTTPEDNSHPLTKAETKTLQEIIETLPYYARAVNSTIMLVALGSLAALSYSTMQLLTQMPPSGSKQVTWSLGYTSTVMPPTYLNHKHAQAHE